MGESSDIGPVLVTGAGGFIGRHVVRRLSEDPELTVIAATRDGRENSRRVDLRDPAGLRAAVAGAGAIVHCAVGDRAVTVDGTRALLAAAAEVGARRFVHLSSVAVYGGATGEVNESTPMVAAGGRGYGAWKAAAEQACVAQAGLEVVRLRPAIVYGPGSTLWIDQMAKRIQSGRWGVFGSAGEGICNPVHVFDVANAIRASLRTKNAGGAALNISGTETMTWNRWFSSLAEAIGAPPLRPVSPVALKARVAASLPLKALSRFSPGLAADWLLGAPARSELSLFALRASYPIDAAQSLLGWKPEIGIVTGLADSFARVRDDVARALSH